MSESSQPIDLPPDVGNLIDQLRRMYPVPVSIHRDEMLFQMAIARTRTPIQRLWPILAITACSITVILAVLLWIEYARNPLPIILRPAPALPELTSPLGKDGLKLKQRQNFEATPKQSKIDDTDSSGGLPTSEVRLHENRRDLGDLYETEEERIAHLKRGLEIHRNVLSYGLGLLPTEPLGDGNGTAMNSEIEIAPGFKIPAGAYLSPKRIAGPQPEKKKSQSIED